MALIRSPESTSDQRLRRWLRPGLAGRVLIGLVLGIAAGVFFGEVTHALKSVGDAFIMLLQVAVIPYIVASLITALGRLTLDDAKKLGLKAGGVLLVQTLDAWLIEEKAKGTVDALYRYWMLGDAAQRVKPPRWSVIRNVLHWVP